MKKYQIFFSENLHFLVVKFSLHLNRCVFVMHMIGILCIPLQTGIHNEMIR